MKVALLHAYSQVPAHIVHRAWKLSQTVLIAATVALAPACASSSSQNNLPNSREKFGVQVIRSVRYYKVSAFTPVEVRRQVDTLRAHRAAPPAPSVGLTTTSWTIRNASNGVRTSCSRTPVAIELHIEMFIPQHTNPVKADSVMTWNDYVQKLTEHEARHDSIAVAITNAFLSEVHSNGAVVGVSTIRECAETLNRRQRLAQTRYDSVTSHGIREGVALRARPRGK